MWSVLFFVLAMLLCKAHSESGYEYGKAKSNSLLYLYNADTGKANWATYKISIRGRKVTGENPKDAADLNEYPLFSTILDLPMQPSPENLATPTIAFLKDRRK
jgi:hypothetical protein